MQLETLTDRLKTLSAHEQERLAAWLAELRPPESVPHTHHLRGRLWFQDWKPGTPSKPLHHFRVEVRTHPRLGHARVLACGYSDAEGHFELPFTAPDQALHALSLCIVEELDSFGPHQQRSVRNHTVHHVDLPEALPEIHDLGDIPVPYWPYCYAGELPRVLIPPGAEPPQDYAPGRKTALLKTVAEWGLIRTRHLLENKVAKHLPHLETIQRDYPENLTLRLEREQPGSTRSDAYFAERVLNGLNPCLPLGDRRYPGELRVGFNWDAYEMDGVHALPNVDAWFVQAGEHLQPTRIRLQWREAGATQAQAPMQPERFFTPADGANWARAKRLFRTAWALHGQIVAHLATSHLSTEQYAIAAFRNLRRNPLRDLLFPHLKEVAIINHGGNGLIFGEHGYVTVASALTREAIDQLFVDTLGTLDWKGWQPRTPLCQGHTFARAAQLYWQVVCQHVAEFIAAHRADIETHWLELRRMSDDVVQHAVPYVPPALQPWDEVRDPNEMGDRTTPRAIINGVTKAVRPFATQDQPAPDDWAQLAQLCSYMIYHATFFHAWANDRQHDDGGELRYAALGLRHDGWGDEGDETVAQSPAVATDQIFLSMFLQYTGYGYILKNEDHDIPERFVELLAARADEFRALGFEAHSIRSRINI